MTITLYNSMTRRKEVLTPVRPGEVSMYVCGPTVYDRAHIGNARPVVVFDVLYRLLRYNFGAGAVTYVRNFTDVDDKINARAAEMAEAGDTRPLVEIVRGLTDETIAWYLEDMGALGALEPNYAPRATDYIPQMISLIQTLIETGHAYAAEGHALFEVATNPNYGRLSRRSLDEMQAGARVEVAPYKRSPMDFVLWKPSTPDQPGWDSPWGRGRPGWHIECSAMAADLLGDSFDIHGGGIDLQFPHHENELAQSCCAAPDAGFANIWMHNGFLQVEGEKMSKSLGNFFTVKDLRDQDYAGEVIRFVLLGTHYRSPTDWTAQKAAEAEATLRKWAALAEGVAPAVPDPGVIAALSDDLNVPGAVARLHALAKEGDAATLLASAHLLGFLKARLPAQETSDLSAYADQLATLRATAMETKDFAPVDALKSGLMSAGVEVRMSKAGIELIPGPGFDSSKLEGLL